MFFLNKISSSNSNSKSNYTPTSVCLVANPDPNTFAKFAAIHIAAYIRSNCLDDECADNACMLPGFENKIVRELKQKVSSDLFPRMLHSLSMFLSHPIDKDELWIIRNPDKTEKKNKEPNYPLMRRGITVSEFNEIKDAVKKNENIEEVIFNIGSKTRTWTMVCESPPDKLSFFNKPAGFASNTPALDAHIASIKQRNQVPRVMPPGVHILNIKNKN